MKVKSKSEVAQSCPTLSDPMDCSLPGSLVHGIFQARELKWVAIAFSIKAVNMNKNVGMFKITRRNGLYISQLGDSIIYHPKWNLFKSERGQPNRKPGKQE